jgi:hypothetical protein
MLEEIFKNKSVLFIGVEFYEYHLAIKQKIEQYGAKVTFFAERNTSIMYGIVNRLLPKRIDSFQKMHYASILKTAAKTKFDYLLVIRGYRMPLSFIKEIKNTNPGIKTIMYQWDANVNSPYLNLDAEYNLIPEFDKVISFDYKDVQENSWIKYSPTFYIDEIKRLESETRITDKKYDFFFFGSYLPERYNGLLKFRDFAEKNGYSLYVHFYMPYRYYLIERLKGTKLDLKLIKFNPMKRKKYLSLFSQSKAIVDVSNAKQTGMAMRVIDAIGSGRKVLTTNTWVKNELNYNPNQIAIVDLDNLTLPPSFLETEVAENGSNYSIDKWLENLFLTK